MGISLRALLIAGLFGQVTLSLHAQQLLDDFNRAASTTVGGGWTEVEPSTGQAQVNSSGQLAINSGTPAARTYVVQDMDGFYGTTLSSNSCMLTWAFCIRQTQTDPSGFNANAYGAAFVLGASGANLASGTTGYAVVYGQSGGTDPLRLVRFSNGISSDGVLTNVISASPATFNDLGNQYLAVRVTYTPSTNTWAMYGTVLSAPSFSTTDPLTASTLLGSASNATYTSSNLRYIGCLWNHSTTVANAALFDNITIPQLCIPIVNFTTTTALVNENVGGVLVTMNIFPATATGGDIVVTVTNGLGVVYGAGNDYTTTPAVVGTDITIPVSAGATSASFIITVNDELVDENNETITFSIGSTTGDLILGSDLDYEITIIDDDGGPTVNFTTTSITVLENAGIQTFFLSISPPPVVAGNVTISVTNGPGVTCGGPSPPAPPPGPDYIVYGIGCPPAFTVPFAIGQTSISFQATVYDDIGVIEVTEQVTFTVTGVPGGMSIGSSNTGVLNIADNDSPETVLGAGDIAIVGVNANNGACPGASTGEDLVSFFSFKPIQFGTRIILTDNGYERCTPGLWGNTEGTVELRRTGPMIPAGQVITLRITNSSGAGNVIGVAPDASWTCTSLNGGTTLALNVGGDQIFFMQGGTWSTNTVGGNNATYTGTVVYGFSTNPSFPWSATCASPAGNQRSNLPPGMNCFSMSPVSASDFSKYTGLLTVATQRDWIIRLDNTANWSTYGSCGAYNAANPNWLLAPTLPITPGTPTPGLWRGAATAGGTDWFDCKNWDDAVVPTATTNVRIDETANNHCVVGITTGGTAVCASLVQTNSGTPRNLTVQNGSSLAVGGPITVQRTSPGTQIALTVLGNSTLTATNFTVQGTAANEAVLRNEVAGNTVSFSGDLTINPGGVVDVQGTLVGGTISVAGNYQNLEAETALQELYGTIRFNGIGSQNITTSGFTEIFENLVVNKPGGSLNLNNSVDIRGTLTLTNGLVNTTATEIITVRAGGTATGSSASFVNGPMVKVGNTNFTFPVGKGSVMRPCGVSGIVGAITSAFRAEYFPADPSIFGTTGDPTLHHISTCEYWTLDRAAGTPNATVTLTWEAPYSCGVTDPTELRVAEWDETAIPAPGTWRDRGAAAPTPSLLAGSVSTATVQSQFNATTTPWTLASITQSNPLPISLLRFTAQPEGNMVRLDWLTASEQDNALFTVERSRDAMAFEEVLNVPGALNSSTLLAYSELDRNPYPGLSYYRLRQTDTDGTSTWSDLVSVLFGPVNERPLVVYGSGETWTAVHSFPAGSTYELVDMTGRRVLGGRTAMEGRTDLYGVVLSRGAYLFRITDGERMESQRFVY